MHKIRERDFRGLLDINVPPLMEKAPKQQIADGKELQNDRTTMEKGRQSVDF